MITRAIIEEVIDTFSYRVRIPIFDRIESASEHTSFENLLIAKASVSRGSNNQFQRGDIVFIAFENNDLGAPVIIGHLYRNALLEVSNSSVIESTSLNVSGKASLPMSTTIGDIQYSQLFYLANVQSDLQGQLDELTRKIEEQAAKIKELESKNK